MSGHTTKDHLEAVEAIALEALALIDEALLDIAEDRAVIRRDANWLRGVLVAVSLEEVER